MLSVQEAQERILAQLDPLETSFAALEQAAGWVLSEPIQADTDLPPFDNSSVDGFALRAADLAGLSQQQPARLKVIADIPAGSTVNVLIGAEQAARIMTGAPLPAGADAVVMVEETDFNERSAGSPAPEQVLVFKTVQPGENIRRRAADIQAGQAILPANMTLRAQDIGMLAMLGVSQVPVRRKPRVALISSGDELLPVEAALEPGKIRDANTYTLAVMAQNLGCEVLRLGIAADRYEAVEQLFARAVELQPDVIVASAGISVGAYDFVKDVVESSGSLDFWKVNMRPGKPLAFGRYQDIPFFGLPGNPVSSFVSFLVFVQPALQRLKGLDPGQRQRVRAVLAQGIESDGRESYLRASVTHRDGINSATLTGHQGSGNLFSLVQANALLIIPSGVKSCPPGSEVEAWILEN